MPLHVAARRALPAFVASFFLALFLLAATRPATVEVPAYGEFLLYARANFTGAFRIPDSAFFANTTPRLNAAGEMAFNVAVISGTTSQGLWWGDEAAGGIVYQTPADAFVFGVGLNEAGIAVFEQALSPQDGLWLYDPESGPAAFATDRPLGASGWGSPAINATGELGYRADFAGDHAWVSWDGSPSPAIHAVEAGADVTSPYSFLFTPAFNDAREIAGKVRYGTAGQVGESQPDEIRRFAAAGTSVLLAADVDAQPGSPYARFDNAVALTGDGRVAFATLAAGDIAFAAGLTPPGNDQVEWGTGAFVALAVPRTIFADGFETGDTSAWTATTG